MISHEQAKGRKRQGRTDFGTNELRPQRLRINAPVECYNGYRYFI